MRRVQSFTIAGRLRARGGKPIPNLRAFTGPRIRSGRTAGRRYGRVQVRRSR